MPSPALLVLSSSQFNLLGLAANHLSSLVLDPQASELSNEGLDHSGEDTVCDVAQDDQDEGVPNVLHCQWVEDEVIQQKLVVVHNDQEAFFPHFKIVALLAIGLGLSDAQQNQ